MSACHYSFKEQTRKRYGTPLFGVLQACNYCEDIWRNINLMLDIKDWNVPKKFEEEVILTLKYKRPTERPKKSKHKNSDETISSSTNCCGRCGHEGHNRRTCNFFAKEKWHSYFSLVRNAFETCFFLIMWYSWTILDVMTLDFLIECSVSSNFICGRYMIFLKKFRFISLMH